MTKAVSIFATEIKSQEYGQNDVQREKDELR